MNFSSSITSSANAIPSKAIPEVRCEVCQILLSSYVVLRDHRQGRKHKNQLKLLIREKKIDLNCIICSTQSSSFDDWELHVTSEKHVENLKHYKPIAAPPPMPTTLRAAISNIPPLLPPKELDELTTKLHANINQQNNQLNQNALKKIFAKEKKEWNCSHCKVTCQSICSWEAHLASHKHRKNRHKFHTYPGISKEFVKKKYQNSFVRAAETIGNEFIEEGVIFYCKRCDVRMQNKLQLEVHMSSNQHKINHPIPVVAPQPVQNNQQFFNFESSSYGYGHRNWTAEQNLYNQCVPQITSKDEIQQQLVEKAKTELLARFPFYAINLQNDLNQVTSTFNPNDIPMPVEAPNPVEAPSTYNN